MPRARSRPGDIPAARRPIGSSQRRRVRGDRCQRLRQDPGGHRASRLSAGLDGARGMTAALKVVSPGLHTTVQDLGRFGYQEFGVPVSGALDATSHRLANRIVGNDESAPTLEILFQGPTLEVMADSVRVGVAGGDAEIEILDESSRRLGGWRSVLFHRGQIFRVSRLGDVACCYLAVEGGLSVERCLGSASTYT